LPYQSHSWYEDCPTCPLYPCAPAESAAESQPVELTMWVGVTDVRVCRAIFRWITVKDLNVMEFDESVKQDTPLGLLRGIKFGTETYHTLFMRLCRSVGRPLSRSVSFSSCLTPSKKYGQRDYRTDARNRIWCILAFKMWHLVVIF